MRRRHRKPAVGSRDRLLGAAAAEFAARGFAGGGVDRIARRARLNKAMIYYHFRNKAGLYREVLCEMFRATGSRVEAIASSDVPAPEKVKRFVAAFADEATQRPHIPPMMLRELAEEGQHLDPDTLALLRRVPRALETILAEGVRSGTFAATSPFLTYSTIVGPLMFFLASAPVRRRLDKLGAGVHAPEINALVAYVQDVALSGLMRPREQGDRRKRARHASETATESERHPHDARVARRQR